MKNANLRRYPHPSSLRRTTRYASLLGISGALHLDVFDQPAQEAFFSDLLVSSKPYWQSAPPPLCPLPPGEGRVCDACILLQQGV